MSECIGLCSDVLVSDRPICDRLRTVTTEVVWWI